MDNIETYELFISTFSCELTNAKYTQLINDHLKYGKKEFIDFSNYYFNCFFLLTRIGKCIYSRCNINNVKTISIVQLEYFSVLFAKAYLEYKNEKEYLQEVNSKIQSLVKMHEQTDGKEIDVKYDMYEKNKNYQNYAVYHFSVVNKAFDNKLSFESVLRLISNGKFSNITTGIILQKGLSGINLVNECIQTVMEMNGSIPDVKIQYLDLFEIMFENRIIEIA